MSSLASVLASEPLFADQRDSEPFKYHTTNSESDTQMDSDNLQDNPDAETDSPLRRLQQNNGGSTAQSQGTTPRISGPPELHMGGWFGGVVVVMAALAMFFLALSRNRSGNFLSLDFLKKR
jgi:hypothetical protein